MNQMQNDESYDWSTRLVQKSYDEQVIIWREDKLIRTEQNMIEHLILVIVTHKIYL